MYKCILVDIKQGEKKEKKKEKRDERSEIRNETQTTRAPLQDAQQSNKERNNA